MRLKAALTAPLARLKVVLTCYFLFFSLSFVSHFLGQIAETLIVLGFGYGASFEERVKQIFLFFVELSFLFLL